MRPARRLDIEPGCLRVTAVRQVVVAMSVVDDAEIAPAGAARRLALDGGDGIADRGRDRGIERRQIVDARDLAARVQAVR